MSNLPPPDHDVTNGLVAPVMPNWAYIAGMRKPIWEWYTKIPGFGLQIKPLNQPGSHLSYVCTFAPVKNEGELYGFFASNIPWIIDAIETARQLPDTLGLIHLAHNSTLPNEAYVDNLRKPRHLQDMEADPTRQVGVNPNSIFSDRQAAAGQKAVGQIMFPDLGPLQMSVADHVVASPLASFSPGQVSLAAPAIPPGAANLLGGFFEKLEANKP